MKNTRPNPLRLIDPTHQHWADEAFDTALAMIVEARDLPDFEVLSHALIVAHRSSTVMHADVLEQGGIEANDFAFRWLDRDLAWMVADVPANLVAGLISVAGSHMSIGVALDDDASGASS